jgi:hypothetical protein
VLKTALTTMTLDSIVKKPRDLALELVVDATGLAPSEFILEVVHLRRAAVRILDGTTTRAELFGSALVLEEGATAGVFHLPAELEHLVTALLWNADHPLTPNWGARTLAAGVHRLRAKDALARDARREAAMTDLALGASHELARRSRTRAYTAEAELVSARRACTSALEAAAAANGVSRPFDVLSKSPSASGWSVQVRRSPGAAIEQHHAKGVGLGELLVSLELPRGAEVRFTSVLSPHLAAFRDVTSTARNADGVLHSELGWEDATSVLARQHIS